MEIFATSLQKIRVGGGGGKVWWRGALGRLLGDKESRRDCRCGKGGGGRPLRQRRRRQKGETRGCWPHRRSRGEAKGSSAQGVNLGVTTIPPPPPLQLARRVNRPRVSADSHPWNRCRVGRPVFGTLGAAAAAAHGAAPRLHPEELAGAGGFTCLPRLRPPIRHAPAVGGPAISASINIRASTRAGVGAWVAGIPDGQQGRPAWRLASGWEGSRRRQGRTTQTTPGARSPVTPAPPARRARASSRCRSSSSRYACCRRPLSAAAAAAPSVGSEPQATLAPASDLGAAAGGRGPSAEARRARRSSICAKVR